MSAVSIVVNVCVVIGAFAIVGLVVVSLYFLRAETVREVLDQMPETPQERRRREAFQDIVVVLLLLALVLVPAFSRCAS